MTISNHSLIYNKSFRTPSPGFQDRTDGIKNVKYEYFPFVCFEGDISNMPPHGFTTVWLKEAQKLKAKMGSRFYSAAERISFSSFLWRAVLLTPARTGLALSSHVAQHSVRSSVLALVLLDWLWVSMMGFSSGLLMGSRADFCLSEMDQPGKPSTRCPSCGKVRGVVGPPGCPVVLRGKEGCRSSLDSQERKPIQSVPGLFGHQALLLSPQFVVGCSLAPADQVRGPLRAAESDGSC